MTTDTLFMFPCLCLCGFVYVYIKTTTSLRYKTCSYRLLNEPIHISRHGIMFLDCKLLFSVKLNCFFIWIPLGPRQIRTTSLKFPSDFVGTQQLQLSSVIPTLCTTTRACTVLSPGNDHRILCLCFRADTTVQKHESMMT